MKSFDEKLRCAVLRYLAYALTLLMGFGLTACAPISNETPAHAIQKTQIAGSSVQATEGPLNAADLSASGTVSATADYKRNLNSCIYGSPYCDLSVLSSSDVQQVANKSSTAYTPYQGGCAENGSCYGDISTGTGRPKTVAVSGYTRSDGTYVRGYYRSPPSR